MAVVCISFENLQSSSQTPQIGRPPQSVSSWQSQRHHKNGSISLFSGCLITPESCSPCKRDRRPLGFHSHRPGRESGLPCLALVFRKSRTWESDQVDQVYPPKTVPVLPTVEWIRMVTASSCITVKSVTTVLCRCYCCAGRRRTPGRKVCQCWKKRVGSHFGVIARPRSTVYVAS